MITAYVKKTDMAETTETGQDIELTGWSGNHYGGKIYADKNSTSAITGRVIACLSNSELGEEGWSHRMNSIYAADSAANELAHFSVRDDISHLILIPFHSLPATEVKDKVDDLIRSYLHR